MEPSRTVYDMTPFTHTSHTGDICLYLINSLPSNQNTWLPCSLLPLNQPWHPG